MRYLRGEYDGMRDGMSDGMSAVGGAGRCDIHGNLGKYQAGNACVSVRCVVCFFFLGGGERERECNWHWMNLGM